MPQVVVRVNDRPYTMVCDEGEEQHLIELAQMLDEEVTRLKKRFGQVGDSRLLLMAALVIADRLAEAQQRIESLRGEIDGLKDARAAAMERGQSLERAVICRLDAAAQRIEALTLELDAALK